MDNQIPVQAIDRRFSKPLKEIMCLYGEAGVGKSHMLLTVAKWYQTLGSDRHFYIISTDQAYGPMLQNDEFADLDNITVDEVYDLQEFIDAAKKANMKARQGDWIVADRIDHGWSWSQDEYAKALAKKEDSDLDSLGDLWRAEGLTGEYPIKGWEWGMPNGRYRSLRQELLTARANVMVMADEKELLRTSSSGNSSEPTMSKNTFRHIGCKPTGQKEDASCWHTILHVESPAPKQQAIATAKDKFGNREWLGERMSNGQYRHVPIEDLFTEYFVNVAGWKMG